MAARGRDTRDIRSTRSLHGRWRELDLADWTGHHGIDGMCRWQASGHHARSRSLKLWYDTVRIRLNRERRG